METKTLAFDVRDIERFKEFFPDFSSGTMSARELGRKLIEVLENQTTSPATTSLQVDADSYNHLQEDYKHLQDELQDLQGRYNQLQAQLAEKVVETPATPENKDLQDLQQQLQDAINVKNNLQEKLQTLQADNQRLQELQEKATSDLQVNLQELQDKNATLEARCKDLKAQLKEATSHQDAYTFTPYFKELVEVVTAKINEVSATAYTPTDVIMQTLFATYFNSHTSIRYTYPISKAELLALAQQFYPELQSDKELFELMIYKVKEEQA